MTVLRLFQTRSIRWALISALVAGVTSYLMLQYVFVQKVVVVANRRIEAGVPVKRDWLNTKELPAHSINEATVSDIDSVVGNKLTTVRMPDDILTRSCLERQRKDMPTKKPGFVIVSLNVRDYQPLAGYVSKNSVINIIAVDQTITTDKNPESTVIKGVRLIEAKKITKTQTLQKADTSLLIEVPMDLAERLIALESRNYFKIVVDQGG